MKNEIGIKGCLFWKINLDVSFLEFLMERHNLFRFDMHQKAGDFVSELRFRPRQGRISEDSRFVLFSAARNVTM